MTGDVALLHDLPGLQAAASLAPGPVAILVNNTGGPPGGPANAAREACTIAPHPSGFQVQSDVRLGEESR